MEFLFVVVGFTILYFMFFRTKKPDNRYIETNSETHQQPVNIFCPSEDNEQTIRAMLHLGKADGQLRDEEILIIIKFLIKSQPEHKESSQWYLISCIRNMKPFSADEYQYYLGKLDKKSMELFLTWMEIIFKTQKKNHPYEDILLNDLKNRISKI